MLHLTDVFYKAVGHKPGAPVRVLMTRANAPDISYRTPPPPPPEDVPALSPSGVSSILPPAGAMRSLLNGRGGTGSGSRISEGSPYASSAATNWDGRPSSLSAHSYGRQRSLSESQRQPHSLLSHSAGGGGEGRSQSRSGMTAGQQSHHSVHHSLRPSSGMGSGGTSFSGVGRPLGASARNVQAPAVIRGGDSRSDRRGSAGFMTRGTGQAAALRMSRSHVGAPSDPIGWISGVRMQRDTTITSQGSQATRGRGGGKAIASGLPASETGRHSDLVEGHESTTAPLPESEELDEQPQNLGEEFMAVNRRLPRATFEKVSTVLGRSSLRYGATLTAHALYAVDQIEVAQRTCTISLYGPWADREPAFLRIAFAFPSDYPNAAPRYDLERNANVPLKARAFLLRNLAAIVAEYARRAQPSMEPCIRFLLGENLAQGSNVAPALDADESDDEDVPFQMLMPPRLSGASFGPNGEQFVRVFSPIQLINITDFCRRRACRLRPCGCRTGGCPRH